jgi:hypothetical protein
MSLRTAKVDIASRLKENWLSAPRSKGKIHKASLTYISIFIYYNRKMSDDLHL